MKLTETQEQEVKEFISRVEISFRKYFPNGYFTGYISRGLGPDSITIRFGLIKDQNDCSNNIRENDPLYTIVSIYPKTNLLEDNNELTTLQSGLSINPIEKYFAMSRVKTAIRKSKGTLDKLEKTLDNYFKKVADIVIENKDNIYKINTYDKRYLNIKG